MGLLKDTKKDEDDPIMKLNPTLYKAVAVKRNDPGNFTDPFQKIMEQQHQWEDQNANFGYIKNLVYRSDIDHPNSLHNSTTQQKMQVQFP